MYIFSAPAKAYDIPFTFQGISDYIDAGRGQNSRMVGTTLELSRPARGVVSVRLYGTAIARLWDDGEVLIHERINNHGSQATTWWVAKVLQDNKIGGSVFREAGKYAVAGKTYNKAD